MIKNVGINITTSKRKKKAIISTLDELILKKDQFNLHDYYRINFMIPIKDPPILHITVTNILPTQPFSLF